VIGDLPFAVSVLKRVNYYRFTGYLLPYRTQGDAYLPGTNFENVYRIYEFDAELRNRLLWILEKVEVAMRVNVSYYLGHTVSPLAHRYRGNFQNIKSYLEFRKKMKHSLKHRNKKDAIVTHHFAKYKGRFPIWVTVEFMSFDQLSFFYSNLLSEYQSEIANQKGISSPFLRSWLRTLVYLRNACAHSARIYGKYLTFSPRMPNSWLVKYGDKHLYTALYVCARLCLSRTDWERFLQSLTGTIEAYEEYVDISLMGFPDNWYEELRSVQRNHSTEP